MSKIYFSTTAYNAEKTISRCIDSVLNQTQYGEDIVYYICDNGSTDRTGDIIKNYAENDTRIKFFYNEINNVPGEHSKEFGDIRLNMDECDYYCTIDSDDAYELDFLEKMIPFMQKNKLDIAACGYNFVDGKTEAIINKRTIDEQLIITNAEEFSESFYLYHQFMRPVWAKVFSGRVTRKSFARSNWPVEWLGMVYGTDTLITFSMLKKAERVGVLPDLLHNYYIYEKSVSHQYNPKQSDSDIFLFNDAIDFLSQYGEISVQNMQFIHIVYANAIKDTIKNLVNSKLSAEEKLKEYLKIFVRPETHNALSMKNETIDNVRCELTVGLLSFATEINEEFEKVLQILNILVPDCASAVNEDTVKLFSRNDTFKALLFKNDRSLLSDYILALISNDDKLTRVYDFAFMLGALANEGSLASIVKSTELIKLYTNVYSLLWNSKNTDALAEMTEILLSGNELNCPEEFLNVFVTLAALENHAEAFIFGNIQKAYLFIDENRKEEARAVVNDLIEMGAGETEDVIELVKILQ